MGFKVIQWGAGNNGGALIRAVARHADLELVGCRVWSDAKNGVDAGTLAGIAPLGVAATTDRRQLIDLPADVVLCCPRLRPDMTENDQDIIDLLRAGKNVISVSGAHSMPAAVAGDYGARFEAACRAGGTTFAAAGLNPGFIAERLAPTLTGLCADVDAVRVEETYDCSVSNPDVFYTTMGFGRPIDAWTNDSPTAGMFNQMFAQSIHNMARTLGVKLARVKRTASVAQAPRDLTAKAGIVRQGTVAAIIQSWEGVPEEPGQIIVAKTTRWVCGPDIPGYPVNSGWQIRIEGKPCLLTMIKLDPGDGPTYLAEFMVGGAISVIPEVVAARPGFLLPAIYAPFRKRFLPELTRATPGQTPATQ